MNDSGFDALTRRLASARLSRRRAIRQFGAGGLAAVLLGATIAPRLTAAQATPAASQTGELAANNATLFVQTASGGSFGPNPQAGQPLAAPPGATPAPGGTPVAATHGAYLLTLHGHNGETIAFSDRPQRTFGEVKTTQFFTSMGFTPVNPPNAALVADTPHQQDAVSLVELLHPSYDGTSHTLTYEANLLHQYPNAKGSALVPLATKAQGASPAATFTTASLFIDDCPDLWGCYLGPNNIGALPGAPIGQCWNWSDFACLPCDGNSLNHYAGVCNSAYPKQCLGACYAD